MIEPDNDAHRPIDPDALEPWSTHEPPEGFAQAVIARHFDAESEIDMGTRTDDASPQTSSRSTIWVASVAVALAACAVLWFWRANAVTRDALVAQRVETVQLDRATVVAQPGARLRWRVEGDGTTTIHQDAGSVFYRVEPGERFEVITPAGTATVTGTCFEVDLEAPSPTGQHADERADDMKSKAIKAGALGAALAAATVVTVYEGGVVLANDAGQVDVAAGERGRAHAGSAPVHFGPDGASDADGSDHDDGSLAMSNGDRGTALPPGVDPIAHIRTQARDLERMRAQKDEQAKTIAALEARVEELGGALDTPEAKKRRAKKCASQSRGGDCPFLDPDQDTLLEMAKCATVKIDAPGFLDDREPPERVDGLAQQLGVTDPKEREQLAAASQAHYEAYNAQLRAMYLELGGDPEIAEDASPETLVSAISDQLDPQLAGDIQRKIAQERAGLVEPPAPDTELPFEERLLRLQAELGNTFESHVAKTMGPERANELRHHHDGWPGSTSVHSGNCIE